MVMAYNNFMKPEELIRHFGDVEKAAAGVGVTLARSINGLRLGRFHRLRQSDIEVRTAYKLKSDFTVKRVSKDGSDGT